MEQVTVEAQRRFGIADSIDLNRYCSIVDMYDTAVERFAEKPAFSSLGHTINYRELQHYARQFAVYLKHHTSLQPGDRIAVQLPNLIQHPIVTYGAMLAGLVVVNTNPLYTARELEHQLKDSGAKALVVLANVAKTAQFVVANTDVETVIVTELADLHPWYKRLMINLGARYVHKMVPELNLPGQISLRRCLALGKTAAFEPEPCELERLALLQYTGGTTGVAKGAMLSHRNLVANALQCQGLFKTYGLQEGAETLVVPLPMYHIYSFTLGVVMATEGNHCVLVPNPRDTGSMIAAIQQFGMTMFCGINTLFVSLCHEPAFKSLDFSRLKLTLSGGMALTENAAKQWHEITGVEVHQGYGLTETSPVLSANPGGGNRINSIGLPVAMTEFQLRGEQGRVMGVGEPGELCARGPQVMAGYWQRPKATADVLDDDGWFMTGDIAVLDPDGYYRIVDRKKDMIIVSGFNVYPNELDDILTQHPGVLECAAVGVPDEVTGEAIRMFVVKSDPNVTEQDLIDYCRRELTGYKVPRQFRFVDELPKSAVGKILRRELRDGPLNH